VSPGENLSLMFADGKVEAKAKGAGSGANPSRAKPEQAKLF
jgi:hypothetical protein